MPRTLKIRRRLAWSATIVTLVVLIAWIGSGWCVFGYIFNGGSVIGIEHASVGVGFSGSAARPPGWGFGTRSGWDHWPLGTWEWGRLSEYVVPLWLPLLLSTLASAFFWHRYRRALSAARIGLCSKCGYDRAGLAPQSPCPECNADRMSA